MKEINRDFFDNIFHKLKETISNKSMIIMSILFFIIIVGIFNISKPISEKKLISKVQVILEKGKINLANNYIKVEDEEVAKEILEPLIDYYVMNNQEVEKLIYNLKRTGQSGNFTIESKKTFLGESYYLNVKTVEVKFSPTIKEVILYLDNKKIDNSNFISVVPGLYEIEYKLNTDYGNVSEKKSIELFANKEEKIAVEAEYITLYSNFTDAEVFINGKDINKTVSEVKEYGPIPTNKNIVLHIEKNFPWGNIKSEDIELKNENIIKIDLNMANAELLLDIEDTLNRFYNSLFAALNKEDSSLMTDVEESVRKDIFESIYVKAIVFSNNYNIGDTELKIENSEFVMEEENYKANVLVEMNYSIAKKILPFIKEEKEASFLVGLIYEENSWLVESCQKIKLDLEQE